MLTWDFINEATRLQNEMNRLFGAAQSSAGLWPAINLSVSDQKAVVTSELAGVNPSQLEIAVEGETLTISGKKPEPEQKEGETWLRRERSYGEFTRSLELPFRVSADKVVANYENGVLVIELPRAEEEKPRRITVKAQS